MTNAELVKIAEEIVVAMKGRTFGRLYALSRLSFAVDFHPHAGSYLFVDLTPRNRSIYLIVRKLKALERSAVNPSPFHLALRENLSGCTLDDAAAADGGIVFRFLDSEGESREMAVVLYPSPNLIVFDEKRLVTLSHRDDSTATETLNLNPIDEQPVEVDDLSAILDRKRVEADNEKDFQTIAAEARRTISRQIAKRKKLLENLQDDLRKHGDSDKWKKFGDLILASLPNPRRDGDRFLLIDLFDPDLPEISIPADKEDSPNAAAEKYYRKYRKAANAIDAIAEREKSVEAELKRLGIEAAVVEAAIERRDIESLRSFLQPKQVVTERPKKERKEQEFNGARRFASSDGYEVLVGKRSRDNDHLTFRIAKSYDTWLHAADYPGSHVVIRNPNRRDIPQKTLLEAAAMAAFYSDAREIPKAAVNYTLKKFVNKPRRAAPGLVSLSSFKTVLVKPEVPSAVKKVEI